MTLGEKIRNARKAKGITQSQLCKDKITRNMLSEIECDKATPSISTLTYIAQALSLPAAYFLSEDDDPSFYHKKEAMEEIKKYFHDKNYKKCINIAKSFDIKDDELCYILAYSNFELGRGHVLRGSLRSAAFHLNEARLYSSQTVYDTSRIECLILMYKALADNIQSPLLEFDTELFRDKINEVLDFELYKYVIQDHEYTHKNKSYSLHNQAKELLKNRRYNDAIIILKQIENEKSSDNYNAYLIFSVYSDLEYVYKQLANFEEAYRYANKKMSLMEGFKA